MADINKFMKKVFEDFELSITDKIFLLIQNDREYMYEYLRLVEDKGLDKVNQEIGRKAKKRFRLNDVEEEPDREEAPESILIKSHQKLQRK